jgi:uncharacterized membrane protein YdjX (TVP38/TMEM64 family)
MIELALNILKEVNNISYFISIPTFMLLHILFAIFFIPCSPMTILSGVLWGQYGIFIAIVASVLSSATTFLISRYFLADYLRQRFISSDRYKWLMEKTKKNDWKIVAITQLNPIAPASTLGYMYGLCPISFKNYLTYNFLFSLPLGIGLSIFGMSCQELLFETYQATLVAIIILVMCLLLYFSLKKKFKITNRRKKSNSLD